MIKEIEEPKIIKLNIDLDRTLEKGERLTAQFSGGIMIPKEDLNESCFASMNLLIKNENEQVIISLMVQSKVICSRENADNKSRDEMIKEKVFPKLVKSLNAYYNNISANTVVKLPEFPALNMDYNQ